MSASSVATRRRQRAAADPARILHAIRPELRPDRPSAKCSGSSVASVSRPIGECLGHGVGPGSIGSLYGAGKPGVKSGSVTAFEHELEQRLHALRAQGLLRELRRVESAAGPVVTLANETLLNFASNDYLGLANDPVLKEAARDAIERYGSGAGASRLLCGSLAVHHELDDALAAFKGTEAALSFSSGYATALGTLPALVGPGDVVAIDKLAHACVVDAARSSGARLRVFAHNDVNDLERILKWADQSDPRNRDASLPVPPTARAPRRTLIVTESLFSMDGDVAPLREIVELKDRFGAWLMVDEAHATGLYGPRRRGLIEALGLEGRVEVQMGTLGKALGAAGGFISGSRTLIHYLVNRARSFVYSTAPAPATAAAARAAVEWLGTQAGAARVATLWDRVAQVGTTLNAAGRAVPGATGAIRPLLVGAEDAAVQMAIALRERGVFLPAIRYPTVPRGAARLRLTVTAAHTPAQFDRLAAALAAVGFPALEPSPTPARGSEPSLRPAEGEPPAAAGTTGAR